MDNIKKLAHIFGATIRQMRSEVGLSQEEFAIRCHLHRTYIGSIERGEKNVTLETASKIAKALDINLSLIISRMETEYENYGDENDNH